MKWILFFLSHTPNISKSLDSVESVHNACQLYPFFNISYFLIN